MVFVIVMSQPCIGWLWTLCIPVHHIFSILFTSLWPARPRRYSAESIWPVGEDTIDTHAGEGAPITHFVDRVDQDLEPPAMGIRHQGLVDEIHVAVQ